MKTLNTARSLIIFGICAVLVAICTMLCGCQQGTYQIEQKSSTVNSSDLVKAGQLTVGVNGSNAPLASKANKLQGIDVDVASALADELGLKVEFVDVGTSGSNSLENKKVDCVMGIDSASSHSGMTLSSEYVKTGSALFAKDANAGAPVKGDSNIIEGQMATTAVSRAQNQYEANHVKAKTDMDSCFNDLLNGTVNYVAADAVIGSYYALNNNTGAKIVAMLQRPSGYCIGTLEKNTGLAEKIENAISAIKARGTFDVIANKWVANSLNLDSVKLTDGASNEALESDLDAGVYDEIDGTAIQD